MDFFDIVLEMPFIQVICVGEQHIMTGISVKCRREDEPAGSGVTCTE